VSTATMITKIIREELRRPANQVVLTLERLKAF
jgi:hypothetical protein